MTTTLAPAPRASSLPPPPARAGAQPGRYRPLALLAGWLQGLLITVAVVDLVSVVLARRSIRRLGVEPFLDASAWTSIVGTLLCGVAFLVWCHRVAANARALGAAGLEHSPASAVWWWFVPFANLVKVPKVLTEVSRASRPEVPVGSSAWEHQPALAVIPLWWAAWLASRIAIRLAVRSDSLDSFWFSDAGMGLVLALDVVAAGLAVAFVHQLSSLQRHRAVRLARRGEQAEALADHRRT